MSQRAIPKPGEFYRHFKMKYYQILAVATHSETKEQMVVYQALYGDFGVYVRPLIMFMSEVDHEKYPEAAQTYRFERVDCPCVSVESLERIEKRAAEGANVQGKQPEERDNEPELVEKRVSEEKEKEDSKEERFVLDPEVERFLDADTYKEKLDILMSLRNDITDKQLHDMAVTLDVTIEDGDVSDKFMNLVQCLKTMARFEINR